MNDKLCSLIICLTAFMFTQCRKEDAEIVRAYLDVPFQVNPYQKCYLLDTISTTPLVRNSVIVEIEGITDGRSSGEDCMVYAGAVEVQNRTTLNDKNVGICTQYIPGCLTVVVEWNPYVNNNAPRCKINDSLELCLLKVDPSEKPTNKKDYALKYVFKRPK